MTIILAILAFCVLILVHEFGHFIAAKRSGIQVNEFWIGMGPTLLKKEHGGTLYCLKALPFGGACVMEGEDEASDNPHSFGRAKLHRRMIVVVAGACMNFIVGFLIVLCLYLPAESFGTTQIASFYDGFEYEGENMLMVGDEVLKVDGYRTFLQQDVSTGLQKGATDGKFDILVRRNGEKLLIRGLEMKPEIDDGKGGKIYGLTMGSKPATPLGHLQNALYMSVDFGRMVWDSLGMLISGQVGMDQLSGPVGVATAMAETAQTSLWSFLLLVSFISINLGVMNLLPLPALDGGRLLFLIIEGVRRKPVSPKCEGWVHAAGLALLMVLMIYVTGQDIIRLITG